MTDIEILKFSYEKPEVFGELFDRHQARLFRIAKASLGSREAGEDAVQNTFVKIYKYGKKFLDSSGNFEAWSNKILCNCIKDEFKKARGTVVLSEEMEAVLEAESDFAEYESADFLKSILSRADSVSRQVLEMRFLLGKSFKQIARLLGISSGAARVKAYRAKRLFIESYKQIN